MPPTRGDPGESHRLEVAPAAQRDIGRLPARDAARLRGPVLALAWAPRPPGARKLRGSDYWRLRVGDLRMVYAIRDAQRLVIVLHARRRNEATYDRLR